MTEEQQPPNENMIPISRLNQKIEENKQLAAALAESKKTADDHARRVIAAEQMYANLKDEAPSVEQLNQEIAAVKQQMAQQTAFHGAGLHTEDAQDMAKLKLSRLGDDAKLDEFLAKVQADKPAWAEYAPVADPAVPVVPADPTAPAPVPVPTPVPTPVGTKPAPVAPPSGAVHTRESWADGGRETFMAEHGISD